MIAVEHGFLFLGLPPRLRKHPFLEYVTQASSQFQTQKEMGNIFYYLRATFRTVVPRFLLTPLA